MKTYKILQAALVLFLLVVLALLACRGERPDPAVGGLDTPPVPARGADTSETPPAPRTSPESRSDDDPAPAPSPPSLESEENEFVAEFNRLLRDLMADSRLTQPESIAPRGKE